MRTALLFLLLLLALTQSSWAQVVSGKIADESGEPLPFATVTVAGSEGRGTTASVDGAYRIDLGGQGGTLEFRYVGYALHKETIAASSKSVVVDVVLAEAAYELSAPTISASAEDPAYRIMREAAARRAGYLRDDPRYEVDVYIKGFFRVSDAPEKVMGQEVGDMGGLLDSSRAGILYLSETYSTVQIEQPDKFKETVTASKVSGSTQAYSFNTAQSLNFDLYQPTTNFGRPILSPIADNAPAHYRFKMEGARLGEDDKLVYRIRVTARSAATPAWTGLVYVQDETYHILDADLGIAGPTVNAPGLDSLILLQSYRQRSNGGWEVIQRRLEPRINVFGFTFDGYFTAVYSDYDYAPNWNPSPFSKITSEVLAEANKGKDSLFAARPIPLTDAETLDYYRKDSIRLVREDPVYRDSIERKNNKFGAMSLLTGYTNQDWRSNSSWTYGSPLSDFGFHPVTGLYLGAGLSYRKNSDEDATTSYTLGGRLRYGWSDQQVYGTLSASLRLDPIYRQTIGIDMGRELRDYHRLQPVGEAYNAGYALTRKKSLLKLYESRFVRLTHSTRLHRRGTSVQAPWASLSHNVVVEERFPRRNSTDYSWKDKEERYDPNAPLVGDFEQRRDFVDHQHMFRYAGGLTFAIGQRYSFRPGQLNVSESAKVLLEANWRYGLQVDNDVFGERTHFLFLSAVARRTALQAGRFGKFSYRAEAGLSPYFDGPEQTIDLQQFAGTELTLNQIEDYTLRFLGLPNFGLVTRDPWLSAVVEHDFDGWIWQRLPLLRKLGWSFVARGAAIHLPSDGLSHTEAGFAINRIGFGPIRFLRADMLWSYDNFNGLGTARVWTKPIYRVGMNVPVEISSGG